MAWYHLALLSLVAFALISSWHLPRCRLWVSIAVASFVVSIAYVYLQPDRSYAWTPQWQFVAFLCDAAVFIVIREFHQKKWEWVSLGMLTLGCVTLNGLQFMGASFGWPALLPPVVHASILEAANAAYLLLIGGVGILDRLNNADFGRYMRGRSFGGLGPSVVKLAQASGEKSTVKQPLRRW